MNARHLCLITALSAASLPGAAQSFTEAPSSLSFVANQGQITDQHGHPRTDLHYRLHLSGGFDVFVGPGLIQYQWSRPAGRSSRETLPAAYALNRMDVQLLGANKRVKPVAEEQVAYYEQYHLMGQSIRAGAYQKITYPDIYPHIDWVIYLRGNTAEYDFIVHPGGRVEDIRVQYSGALRLAANPDGSVTATTAGGQVTEQRPLARLADGTKIAASFTLNGNIVGFRTAPYSGTLIIDPVLQWGTYTGGSLNEYAYSTAMDKSGNVYMAGSTASTANIASSGAFQATYGGGTGSATYVGDAWLAKFSPAGTRLWTTYYGGTGIDQGYGVAVDTGSSVYLAGFTNSTAGISTTGAQQATIGGGYDAFLAKFDSSGARQWATYCGGTGAENKTTAVACDAGGNVYLAGITASAAGIATTGAHQATIGGSTDAFLVKYNSQGVRQWGTYYGGSSAEADFPQVAADTGGNVYLCGITASSGNIATAAAFQPVYGGGNDGFLVKFSSAGVRQWGTYYGGAAYDRAHAVTVTDSGAVYLSGTTLSTAGIATAGTHQASLSGTGDNLFIARFDAAGQRVWGTYFNGDQYSAATGGSICTGPAGQVYLTGTTASATGIATPGAFKDTLDGSSDAFVARFTPGGQRVWGTYYGGSQDEVGRAVLAGRLGQLYICGETSSGSRIATAGSYQAVYGGGFQDGYLAKFSDCDTLPMPGTVSGPAVICRGGSYTFSVPAVAGAQSYGWSLPAGWTGTSTTNSIAVTAGRDTGTIRVSAQSACYSSLPRALPVRFAATALLSPLGSQGFCSGDSLLLQATTGTGYTYSWLKDGALLAGATDSLYRAGATGYYRLVVSNAGCRDTSGTDTVMVHPLPVPTISMSGGVLSTGNYVTYQWRYNGNPITGAVSSSYTPIVNGSYAVTVTDTNGCSGTSAAYAISGLGVGRSNMPAIRLYPNPAADRLLIDAPVPVSIMLLTVDGRIAMKPHAYTVPVSLKPLEQGIYLVQIRDTGGHLLKTERLVIIR